MARFLPREQQEQNICEGMYEWKLEHFLEKMDELNSPVFKFGTYDSFLKLRCQYPYTDCRKPRKIIITLQIVALLRVKTFSKSFEACLISQYGDTYLNNGLWFGAYPMRNTYKVFSWHVDDDNFTKLLEGILSFRLAWGDDSIKLNSIIQQKTPPDQIKEDIPRKSMKKLSKELEGLYESKTSTDCVLRVGSEQFPVHRALLCARSSVFAAMFHHNTSECSSGVVDISDVDAAVMDDVLNYVYTGQIRGLTPETAASIYIMADKYGFMELKNDCVKFLKYNLTTENVSDAIQMVYFHGEAALERKVILFIKGNAVEIQESTAWNEFSVANPLLSNKYLHFGLNCF